MIKYINLGFVQAALGDDMQRQKVRRYMLVLIAIDR